jgi:hypothetical protein
MGLQCERQGRTRSAMRMTNKNCCGSGARGFESANGGARHETKKELIRAGRPLLGWFLKRGTAAWRGPKCEGTQVAPKAMPLLNQRFRDRQLQAKRSQLPSQVKKQPASPPPFQIDFKIFSHFVSAACRNSAAADLEPIR